MASLQENAEFARRFNDEIWGERNLDAIDDLVADEFVGHDPALQEPIRGPDGVREAVETILTAFPDVCVELEGVVVEGSTIAVRIRCTGTHDGEYMGIEPTGETVAITAAAFQRIEDGALVEEWQLPDRLGVLAQLGVVELPEQEDTGSPAGEADRPEIASTTSPEENKRIARRFPEEVATGGNVDRIDEICTEDVIEHTPLGELRGSGELEAQSEYIHAAFPDVSVTIEEEVAEDDLVAQRLTFRGTHEGEFRGIEPTGGEVEIVNMLFTRIENRRIAERWLLADMLGLLQQLGVVEPPGK